MIMPFGQYGTDKSIGIDMLPCVSTAWPACAR